MAAVMLAGLLPGSVFAAEESTVIYETLMPEYVILNAETGKDEDVYDLLVKGNCTRNYYNAIRRFVKSTGDAVEYSATYGKKELVDNNWNDAAWSDFTSTNLYRLAANPYSGLQVGTSATFGNHSHTHSWGSVFSKKSVDVISYAKMYLSLNGSAVRNLYGSSKASSSTARLGDMDYSNIPGSCAAGKNLTLTDCLSQINYTSDKTCTGCNATIKNQVVCFYDGTAPFVTGVALSGGVDGKNFRAGDTVTVTVTFSEVMRFADNSAKHGSAYVELLPQGQTAGSAKNPKAYLTALQTKTITRDGRECTVSQAVFTYTIPKTYSAVGTISAVNLDPLKKTTRLIHPDQDEYVDYQEGTVQTNSGKEFAWFFLDKSGDGYTTAASPFTDAAGNSLSAFGQHAVTAYFDGNAPVVASVSMDAKVNNGDVKTQLYGKDSKKTDNSDLYLGQGDSASFTVLFDEILHFTAASQIENAVITTNLRKNGQPVTAAYLASGTKKAGLSGDNGASGGMATYITFQSITVTSDMTCADADGVLRVTKVEFAGTTARDASGNAYSALSDLRSTAVNKSQKRLDVTPPAVSTGSDATARDLQNPMAGFSCQLMLQDAGGSGVEGLSGSFVLTDRNGSDFRYQWAAAALSDQSEDKLSWTDGSSGTAYPFVQHENGQCCLYVRFLDTESYDLEKLQLSVTASDYAGNRSQAAVFPIDFVVDNTAPVVTAGQTERILNQTTGAGTLTVRFTANDRNGFRLSGIQPGDSGSETDKGITFVWSETSAQEAPTEGWTAPQWVSVSGTAQECSASIAVAAKTRAEKKLWVRAVDVYGNSSGAICLGTYTYDLSCADYAVNSTDGVTKDPAVELTSLGADDAVLSLYRTADMTLAGEKVWFVIYRESNGNLLEQTAEHRAVIMTQNENTVSLTDCTASAQQLSAWRKSLKDESYCGEMEVLLFAGKKYTAEQDTYTGSFNGNTETGITLIGEKALYTTERRTVFTGGDGGKAADPADQVQSTLTVTESDGLTRYRNTSDKYLTLDGYQALETGDTLLSGLNELTLHLTLGDKLMPEWGVDAYDFSLADDGYTKTRLEVVFCGTDELGQSVTKTAPVSLEALTSQDVRIPASVSAEFGSGVYTFRLKAVMKSGRSFADNGPEGYYYENSSGVYGFERDDTQERLWIQVDASAPSSGFRFSRYSLFLTEDENGNRCNQYLDTDKLLEGRTDISRSAHLTVGGAAEAADMVTIPVSRTVNLTQPSREHTGAAGFQTNLYLVDETKQLVKTRSSGRDYYAGIRWAKVTNTADGETITKWAVCSTLDNSWDTIPMTLIPVDSGAEMKALESRYIGDAGKDAQGYDEFESLPVVRGTVNILTVEFYNLNGRKSETRVLYVNAASDPVTGAITDQAVDPSEGEDPIYSTRDGQQEAPGCTAQVRTVFTPAEGTDTDGLHVYIDIFGKQYSASRTDGVWSIGDTHADIPDDEMTLNPDGTYSYVWEQAYSPLYVITCWNEKTNYISKQFVSYDSGAKYAFPLTGGSLRFDDGAPTVYGTEGAGSISTDSTLSAPALADLGDGTWAMTFAVMDSVIEECGEMTLTVQPSKEYAAVLGVSERENFRFTFAKRTAANGLTIAYSGNVKDETGSYSVWENRNDKGAAVWKLTNAPSTLGIFYAEAEYRSYSSENDDGAIAFITIKGIVPSWAGEVCDAAFTVSVADRFGHSTEPFAVSGSVVYQAPAVYELEATMDTNGYPYFATVEGTDYELTCVFTQPVTVKKSWKCLNPSGYAVEEKTGELPVTGDGEAQMEVYDAFGMLQTVPYTFNGMFNYFYSDKNPRRGDNRVHEVSVSVSETEPTTGDVTITVTAPQRDYIDNGYPYVEYGEQFDKSVTITATENGAYTFTLYYNLGSYFLHRPDSITVYVDNIFKEAPQAEPYFYFHQLGTGYAASELPNRSVDSYTDMTVSGNVTVSCRTDRVIYPLEGSSAYAVLKYDGEQSCSFAYADQLGNIGHLSVNLADYGIHLSEPTAPATDRNAPVVGVAVLENTAEGWKLASQFSTGTAAEEIAEAMNAPEYFRAIRLSLSISEECAYKTIATLTPPQTVSYAAAVSDEIPGVSVSGTSVTLTEACKADCIYLTVVDNAAAETGSETDNAVTMKLPLPLSGFDTTAPRASQVRYEQGLYSVDAYITITDAIDSGDDITQTTLRDGSPVRDRITALTEGVARFTEEPLVFRYTLTENGSKILTFRDLAGNLRPVTVETNVIDDSVPELQVIWSPCAADTDPETGETVLIPEQMPAGPVNRSLTAVLSCTKEIADCRIECIEGSKDAPVNVMPAADDRRWEDNYYQVYESRGISDLSLLFYPDRCEYGFWVRVTVTAPNGKTAVQLLGIPGGVIDVTSPEMKVWAEALCRDGCTEPYAYRLTMFPDDSGNDRIVYAAGASGANRTAYTKENPYTAVLSATGSHTFRFTDAAGNQTIVTIPLPSDTEGGYPPLYSQTIIRTGERRTDQYLLTDANGDSMALREIDTAAPVLTVSPTVQELAASARVREQTVTVRADEACAIEYTYTRTENGQTVSVEGTFPVADPQTDVLSLRFAEETVLTLTAVDGAGNQITKALTITNIDNTPPVLTVNLSTLTVRQNTSPAEIRALLEAGAAAADLWKGTAVSIDPVWDLSTLNPEQVGTYTVTCTAMDEAGNCATATRTVRVYDRNTPGLVLDGREYQPESLAVLSAGEHSIRVTGLSEIGAGELEPCTIYLRSGIRTAGQMKDSSRADRVSGGTIRLNPGYYTIYVVTQSRRTFRVILFAEK